MKRILFLGLIGVFLCTGSVGATEILWPGVVYNVFQFDPLIGLSDGEKMLIYSSSEDETPVTINNLPDGGSAVLEYQPGWDSWSTGGYKQHWLDIPGSNIPEGWDDRTYTFTSPGAADVTIDIPKDAYHELAIPNLTIVGDIHPTFYWDVDPKVSYYRMYIITLEDLFTGFPQAPLHTGGSITPGYQYTGDIFESGDPLVISLQARQNYIGTEINRATTYAVHSAPVPEPTTMLLFGTGLIGLAGLRRRKRQ